jgi:hypothetical protein
MQMKNQLGHKINDIIKDTYMQKMIARVLQADERERESKSKRER